MGFLPHVATKLAIEREIKASASAWTILRPNHFFQNDLTAKPGLDKGLYIQPIGCAAEWSRALGHSVVYVSDVGRWQDGLRPFMPAWMNYDLGLMYRHFGEHGYAGDSRDEERIRELLGRAPRSYADYVDDQAREWGLHSR